MSFEFLLTCRVTPEADIKEVLTDSLASALDDRDEFDQEVINDLIQLRHERIRDTSQHRIIGFSVELPEDIEPAETIIEDFIENLCDSGHGFHIVKFEDPLLKTKLAERAKEIFDLEMKLRRVLSIIYLHAYQSEEPYNLLRDETTKTRTQGLKPQQMKSATENQFFHVTFSQYIQLNQRRKFNVDDILEFVRDAKKYNAFRVKIIREPIENTEDADLLEDLKTIMDPIEQMRNCVAHNRQPSQRLTGNYINACSELKERLDQYLEQWEIQ